MSATSPQLLRSRTAVLAVTGVAVVYGIYVIYTTLPDPKKNSLHRSNAVHGQRPARFRRDQPSETPAEHDGHIDTDADTVTIAETQEPDISDEPVNQPSQGLKGLLYHIAESQAKIKGYEHRGIHCEECGERPILGVRWHCLNCPDFDLCSTCEATTTHQKTHVFAKIKIPLPVLSQPSKEQPLWYPGDPHKLHPPLSGELKKRLGDLYKFSTEHMDAHYDQFTCLANVPWKSDPNKVYAAIDRRAFNKALTSERWPNRFRPNALYDRMFAFYDTNDDDLIGFEEFVSGLSYLRGPQRFTPLRRALQGFDIVNDEYVDRNDFLRIFRAKYEIQKLLLRTVTDVREAEQTDAAMETLRSSLPISSIFSEAEIPAGETRPRRGKTADRFGDLLPNAGTRTIIRDSEGWPETDFQRMRRTGEHARPSEMLQYISQSQTRSSTEPLANERADPMSEIKQMVQSATSADEPFSERILQQIAEDAFHDMLDPLFEDKEQQDWHVIDTREDRKKWRKEIDEVVKDKSRAEVDSSARKEIVDGMIPTDFATLKRREIEIMHAPLDELLEATGYSVNEKPGSSEQDTSHSPSKDAALDPTMPQHRPNSDKVPNEDKAVQAEAPPSRDILLTFGWLDNQDRELQARGGPGRLSFDEVEELVRNDERRELRGLVTGWLEWASF